jgi:hypothetical protein
MLIKARLQGHEFDLLTLAELFREGDPAIASDGEGYCLNFTASQGLLDRWRAVVRRRVGAAVSGQRRRPVAQ